MLESWRVMFPDCEPLADRLRMSFPSRWVRFHHLTGSKRYPDSGDEYAEILTRHNQILDELVGPDPKVILLTTEYSNQPEFPPNRPELRKLDPDAKPWRSVPLHDFDGGSIEPYYGHIFASEWDWMPGVLDVILRLVVDDLVNNVMVVDPGCRWCFHPYDGGMDVILPTSDTRNRLKLSHADWLSQREDGL